MDAGWRSGLVAGRRGRVLKRGERTHWLEFRRGDIQRDGPYVRQRSGRRTLDLRGKDTPGNRCCAAPGSQFREFAISHSCSGTYLRNSTVVRECCPESTRFFYLLVRSGLGIGYGAFSGKRTSQCGSGDPIISDQFRRGGRGTIPARVGCCPGRPKCCADWVAAGHRAPKLRLRKS